MNEILPIYQIKITVIYEGRVNIVNTRPNGYRNLMMLIYDCISTEEFGECLGMGKCATCLVEVLESQQAYHTLERNEMTTLSKHGINNKNVRLSCQILIDEQLDGLKINVISK